MEIKTRAELDVEGMKMITVLNKGEVKSGKYSAKEYTDYCNKKWVAYQIVDDIIKTIDELIDEWKSSKFDNYTFVIEDLKNLKELINK